MDKSYTLPAIANSKLKDGKTVRVFQKELGTQPKTRLQENMQALFPTRKCIQPVAFCISMILSAGSQCIGHFFDNSFIITFCYLCPSVHALVILA